MSNLTEEEFLKVIEKMQRRHELMMKFGLTCMGIIALCFVCFDWQCFVGNLLGSL